MARLEDLSRGAEIDGVRTEGPVEVVDVTWFDIAAGELTHNDAQGRPDNELRYRADEARLEIQAKGPARKIEADSHLFRPVLGANRCRLAHLFDPPPAACTSLVEFPHQIEAVYAARCSGPRRCSSSSSTTPAPERRSRPHSKFQLTFEVLTNDKLQSARAKHRKQEIGRSRRTPGSVTIRHGRTFRHKRVVRPVVPRLHL